MTVIHSSSYRYTPVFLFLLLLLFVKSQETPLYSVPKWSTGISHRTNFCRLHEAVENGEIERRNALRGLNISVGFLRYQLNKETGAIDPDNPDIAIEILDEIATMAGFTFRNSYGVMNHPIGDETWTDFLNWGVGVYDIMGEWFIETVERLATGNALFPEGWYDGNFILVQRQSITDVNDSSSSAILTEVDLFAWTTPFTPSLWGLIAATTIASGFVYYILDYFDSCIGCKPMDVTLGQSVFYTAFSFNGHYTHQPKSQGTRILVFSMAFFFLIIVAAYTANLASFLVLRNQPRLVIESIQDVIRHDLNICVEAGSATEEHLRTYRIPQARIVRGEPPFGEYLDLLDGKCDILLTTRGEYETNRRSAEFNPYCDLEVVGRIVKFESAGFVVGDSEKHCTSLLRDVLHLFILDMKENPTFDLIWEQYREKQATVSCNFLSDGLNSDGESNNKESMGVTNLSGMFVLHCCAILLALISTLVRFCWQPREQKEKMMSDLWSWVRGERALERASFTTSGVAPRPSGGFVLNNEREISLSMIEEEPKPKHNNQLQEQYISSSQTNNTSPLENEIARRITTTPSSSSQSVLLLELLAQTIEDSNQRHQDEMEESNQRHEKEIKQIHQQYQDEMQRRYKEHQQTMKTLLLQQGANSKKQETQNETKKLQATSTEAFSSKTLGIYELSDGESNH